MVYFIISIYDHYRDIYPYLRFYMMITTVIYTFMMVYMMVNMMVNRAKALIIIIFIIIICLSGGFAEPCASLLQLVQLVIIQHSHLTRMTTYDLQMFNDTDVPVVEHLCMASIFFLPPTSSVHQHFGVRLLWLSPAPCAPGRGGGGCGYDNDGRSGACN